MRSRRVPRKIGVVEGNVAHEIDSETTTAHNDKDIVVKRPGKIPSSASKHIQAGTRRVLGSPTVDGKGDALSYKSRITQRLIKPTTQNRSNLSTALPFRADYLNNGQSYDSESLTELKEASNDVRYSIDNVDYLPGALEYKQGLDISLKFGVESVAVDPERSGDDFRIPTQEEIREKKERRKRLAKESEFVSLKDSVGSDGEHHSEEPNDADPSTHSLIIHVDEAEIPSRYEESRLVHEDDDIAEGFDEFVEDPGKVALGSQAAIEQQRRRRQDIETQIQTAQAGYSRARDFGNMVGNHFEDEDNVAQNAAYDAAQTRAGTYGIHSSFKRDMDKESRLGARIQVPSVKPPSDFRSVVSQLLDILRSRDQLAEETKARLRKLEIERTEIGSDEFRIKTLLEETAEHFRKLKEGSADANVLAETASDKKDLINTASPGAPGSFEPSLRSNYILGSGMATGGMSQTSSNGEYSD